MCIMRSMVAGGASFWSNFSYGSRINTPNGCLINAEGSRLIFFEKSKKSPKNNIKIFTHIFYTSHTGDPAGLKSTNLISLEKAWEQWHELQEHGWTEASHNYG